MKLLLPLCFILSLILNDIFAYAPRVDMEYKGGNKRHIGRYGFLLPLYEPKSSLLFTNMFLMHDSKSNVEGNFGLGLRQKMSQNSILGTYGFWDIRKIKNVANKVHQLTIGIEYLTKLFEARINGYFPQNKRFLIDSTNVAVPFRLTREFNQTLGNTIQTIDSNVTTTSKYEIPLAGFDIEIGGNIFDRLEVHTAYYHFNGRDSAKSVNGTRLRSSLYLYKNSSTNHWQGLDIQGELNYDNIRKWSNYLGIRLTWSFTNTKTKPARNSINDKMTQMIIRDVDVISDSTTKSVITQLAEIEETTGFAAALLTNDDIKKLGLENVEFVGKNTTIFSDGQAFRTELEQKINHSSYNLMGIITRDKNNKLTFLPLINSSDNTINTEVSNKISQSISNAGLVPENSLAKTNEQQQAFAKSYELKIIDEQNSTTGILVIAKNAAFLNLNKKVYQDNKNNELYRILTDDLKEDFSKVYSGAGYRYPLIPLVITDPSTRHIGLPGITMAYKMSNLVFNKLPQAIQDKVQQSGIDINEVDILYVNQYLYFSASAEEDNANPPNHVPLQPNEPARIRFNVYAHNNAPNLTPTYYDRHNYIKVSVMPLNGALIDIDNSAPQDIHTHTLNGRNVWSPQHSSNLPLTVYAPTNRVPGGTQPAGAFYSVGIIQPNHPGTSPIPRTGKKAVITLHQVSDNSDDNKLRAINQNGTSEQSLVEKLNSFITGVTKNNIHHPGLDNTHHFIDNILPFAELNSISYTNNVFASDRSKAGF